jgi:hypothetical protein
MNNNLLIILNILKELNLEIENENELDHFLSYCNYMMFCHPNIDKIPKVEMKDYFRPLYKQVDDVYSTQLEKEYRDLNLF